MILFLVKMYKTRIKCLRILVFDFGLFEILVFSWDAMQHDIDLSLLSIKEMTRNVRIHLKNFDEFARTHARTHSQLQTYY